MDPRDVQSIPLFAGLSKDDQQVVAQYADEVDVEAGTVLAQEGRLAYEFFAIKEGTADVTLGGAHAAALGPGVAERIRTAMAQRLAANRVESA